MNILPSTNFGAVCACRHHASLHHASLRHACLHRACLHRACLHRASLHRACLLFACLLFAHLAHSHSSLAAQKQSPHLPATEPISAKEALVDIDDSQLDQLENYVGTANNDATLLKILFRLGQIGLDSIERFANSTTGQDLQQLADEPYVNRAHIYRLSGKVVEVKKIELIPTFQKLYDFEFYYIVKLDSEQTDLPIVLYTRHLPSSWLENSGVNEPASCHGLYLKVASFDSSPDQLEFATQRIGWYPTSETKASNVNDGQQLLAANGYDVSLFDDVRKTNGAPIKSTDGECFYQLLAVSSRLDPETVTQKSLSLDLVSVLKTPQQFHGELVEVEGIVRRVTEIQVNQAYFGKRLKLSHYHQFDVFLPLKGTAIRMKGPKGAESSVFKERYPVTVCVAGLPSGLDPNTYLNQSVRFQAFFFKQWSYQTPLMRQQDEQLRQVSPMFVGLNPEILEFKNDSIGLVTVASLIVFMLTLFLAWWGIWSSSRGDKKFSRAQKNAMGLKPDEITEEKSQPDFSNLD